MTAVTVDQHSSASESGSKTYSTNLTITAGARCCWCLSTTAATDADAYRGDVNAWR